MSDKKTPTQPIDLHLIATETAKRFKGQVDQLERVVGMLYVAQIYGWKVLYLADSPSYIRKAETILGVSFKEQFPAETPYSRKSVAFKLAEGVSNFWKAVKGETPGVRNAELR